MTSRERVRNTMEHKETDRVPAWFEATDYIWDSLVSYLGLESREALLNYLAIDIRDVNPRYIGPERVVEKLPGKDYRKEGLFGQIIEYRWSGVEYNTMVVMHPLTDAKSPSDVEHLVQWPGPDWYDYEGVRDQLDQAEDRATIVGHWGPFQTSTYLYPEDKLYMAMALDPDFCHALFDRMHRFQMEHYERILQVGEGRIDILRTHDDYGTQRGLLFSGEMWDHYFKKHTRELAQLAHAYGAFFQQHSCGAVADIIPRLIECGVDSLEPVQPVEGMEPEKLAGAYGSRLCFCGGIDTQDLLPYGTLEEVRKEIARYIRAFHGPGGYILYPSQAWESCVPLETIVDFYRLELRS